MSTYTNDLGFTLDQVCGRGAFGMKECQRRDFQAWRKIALALRQNLQDASKKATLAEAGSKANSMTSTISRWLMRWIDESQYDPEDAISRGIDTSKAIKEVDPEVENPRFPSDPSIWFQNWQGSWFTFTRITEDLVGYIKEGKDLLERAENLGLAVIDKRLEDASDKPPLHTDWIALGVKVGVVAAVLGAIGYAVNLWAKVRAAKK